MITRRNAICLALVCASNLALAACADNSISTDDNSQDSEEEVAEPIPSQRGTKTVYQLISETRSSGSAYTYSDFKFDGHANLVFQIEGGLSKDGYCSVTSTYSEDDTITSVDKVWYDAYGKETGIHSEASYDEHGNIVREDTIQTMTIGSAKKLIPVVHYYTNSYDDKGRLIEVRLSNEESEVDKSGNVVEDPNGPEDVWIRTYEYGDDDRVVRMSEDRLSGAQASYSFFEEYEYGANGLIKTVRTTYPDRNLEKTTENTYDAHGNLIRWRESRSDGGDDVTAAFEYRAFEIGLSDSVSDAGLIMEGEVPRHTRKPSGSSEQGLTPERLSALDTALAYLSIMAFSESRLIEQLEYEGYSADNAEYAVENCGADWDEQAVRKAREYLDSPLSFSRSRLIEQLEYEGFTSEQATRAADAVGL